MTAFVMFLFCRIYLFLAIFPENRTNLIFTIFAWSLGGQSTTRVKPFICTMPLRLDEGWNQIQFNLSDFTRRAYGTNYVETLRVQVHANCRIRRIYFSDRLYSEEELPPEFKLFLPIQVSFEFISRVHFSFLCVAHSFMKQFQSTAGCSGQLFWFRSIMPAPNMWATYPLWGHGLDKLFFVFLYGLSFTHSWYSMLSEYSLSHVRFSKESCALLQKAWNHLLVLSPFGDHDSMFYFQHKWR